MTQDKSITTETREQASEVWVEVLTQLKSSRCFSAEAEWEEWEVWEVWEEEVVWVDSEEEVERRASASGSADCFMLLAHILSIIS